RSAVVLGPGGLLPRAATGMLGCPLRRAGVRFLVLLPCAVLAALCALGVAGAVARIGGAVGDQVGGEHAGPVGARGVVLGEEARQRARRDRSQKSPRALVAGRAGLAEDLGRALAGLEVLRLGKGGVRTARADEKQNRGEAERSARHS